MSKVRRIVVAAVLGALVLAGAVAVPSSAAAAPGDVGYEDQSFTGAPNPPTADKPQSKLWFHDGSWWGVLFDSVSRTWHIHRLDRSTQTWVDTGVRVDDRRETSSDVLWDGTKLYVATNWVAVSNTTAPQASVGGRPARLYRYSWSPATRTYTLDAGFPTAINDNSSESLTIAEDTTGTLWATWTQVRGSSATGWSSSVYVNSAADGGATWGTPAVLQATNANSAVSPDDISAVVAFGGNRVGVLWGNQADDTVYWAVHVDGTAPGQWQGSVAVRGRGQADDHVNVRSLQSDQAGRVYAAVKTSLEELPTSAPTDPMIQLLQFKPGTGAWTVTTIGTLADCHTRPQVLLDDQQQMVHVVATAPSSGGCPASGTPGTIYTKSAPMADPVFPAGRGTPIIRDADSAEINNATTTKQAVNAGTGMVVLASNTVTKRYWHADLPLGTAPAPQPGTVTAGAASTATSTAAVTDVTVGRPVGVVTGDVLVAEVNADKAPAMAGVPSGWQPVVAPLAVNGLATTFVYVHVVADAAAEPASYTWRLSTAQKWNAGITGFHGVDTATPFDTPATTAVDPSASSTGLTVPGPTTVTPGAMVVGGVGPNSTSATVAPPAGWTESFEATTAQVAEMAYRSQPTAGATGDLRWTFDKGADSVGWARALRPAARA
ncbi:hypothetical protein [Geodermatophilus sp. URMC 63]